MERKRIAYMSRQRLDQEPFHHRRWRWSIIETDAPYLFDIGLLRLDEEAAKRLPQAAVVEIIGRAAGAVILPFRSRNR